MILKNVLGELALWLGFTFFSGWVAYSFFSETYPSNIGAAPLMAGLFALAAIGVRATRIPSTETQNDSHSA